MTNKTVIAALNAATNSTPSIYGPTRFYINNTYAQKWLTENLGLYTDDNSNTLEGFNLNFCWNSQKWYIEG